MRIDQAGPLTSDDIDEHVALPPDRFTDRAFVRLNMIASADGGSAVAGRSGKLGNRDDHAVFAALRAQADVVLVGMATVVSEQYHAGKSDDAAIYVVAPTPDVSGDPELFAAGGATLVLPEDAGDAPAGVATLRAGTGGRVDLARVVAELAGRVVMMEGGPRLAGVMVALGLVDEFFLTLSPRLIGGDSARVVHGLDADPTPWALRHGLVDDQGFVFLRYARSGPASPDRALSSNR
jgi:riboflavin biosynthesis pyrimidine reductase